MATPFDPHANFAYSTVLTAPSPAASGTSLTVQTGDGAKFPAVSFNAVVWPAGAQPTTANAEVVRVTLIATDTFTITRTQESSSARTIVVGDQIATNITAKYLTDIELLAAAQSTITTTGTQTALAIPAGYGPLVLLCNNATTLTIQGIAVGLAGQRLTIVSIGAGNVVLQHQNGGATAANRLVNNQVGDQTLVAGLMSASYTYDTTASRWRQDVMSGQLPATGTSGGILGYTATTTLASSVLLANGALVVGAGAGATPTGVAPVAAGSVLVSNTVSTAPKYTASMTNGQLLIGSTGADAVLATLTAGAGITITPGAGSITVALASSVTLLKAGSGTTTSASASNVDTVAISGLTSKDRLVAYYTIGSVTQLTASCSLFSVTDSVVVGELTAQGTIANGRIVVGSINIQQRQTATTAILFAATGGRDNSGAAPDTNYVGTATLTTAWTGSWTIALRIGAVTAGGTCDWSWALYKIAGQ